jgi:hypothetical protein
MRAFPGKLSSSVRYWTVVDDGYRVVGIADGYLQHLRLGQDAAAGTAAGKTARRAESMSAVGSTAAGTRASFAGGCARGLQGSCQRAAAASCETLAAAGRADRA